MLIKMKTIFISFLTCLFRLISHTPEKKQKQCGATKAAFFYLGLLLTAAPSNCLCGTASDRSGLEQQDLKIVPLHKFIYLTIILRKNCLISTAVKFWVIICIRRHF